MRTQKQREELSQELEWNRSLVTDPEYPRVTSHRRAIGYIGRRFAVWVYSEAGPKVKSVWRLDEVSATDHSGFCARLTHQGPGPLEDDLLVGSIPVRVPGSRAFMWVPRHADVRFLPSNFADPESKGRLSFSFMLSNKHHVDMKIEGVEYLTYHQDISSGTDDA